MFSHRFPSCSFAPSFLVSSYAQYIHPTSMWCAILVRLAPQYFRAAAAVCRCFVDTVSQNLADFQSDVSIRQSFFRAQPFPCFFFQARVPLGSGFPVSGTMTVRGPEVRRLLMALPVCFFCLSPGTGSFVLFRVAFFCLFPLVPRLPQAALYPRDHEFSQTSGLNVPV
jgi:hypothetical protein